MNNTITVCEDGKCYTLSEDRKVLIKYNWHNDKEMILPDGLESIGPYALANFNHISTIYIPKGIKSIGRGAFCECSNLIEIVFAEKYEDIIIYDKAFWKCYSLKSIVLPSGLKKIEKNTFLQCKSLIRIEIPSSVCDIEPNAFNDLDALEFINVADTNQHYISIRGILMQPGKLIRIPENYKCINNGKVAYSIEFALKSASYIETNAFRKTKIESVYISKNIVAIGKMAFENCAYLKEILFEEDSPLTYIPMATFKGCTSLKAINLPNKICIIGFESFMGCISLETISLPEALWRIKMDALRGCLNLKSIIFRKDYIDKIRHINEREFHFPNDNSQYIIYVPYDEKQIFIDSFSTFQNNIKALDSDEIDELFPYLK